jgi:hypothetical protein
MINEYVGVGGMINGRGNIGVLGGNLPQCRFFHTKPTLPDLSSNLGHHGGNPATNRLSYTTVLQSGPFLAEAKPSYCLPRVTTAARALRQNTYRQAGPLLPHSSYNFAFGYKISNHSVYHYVSCERPVMIQQDS